MDQLIDILNDLARRAGEITLKYFQTRLDIITKSDDSPVTIADRETEQFLRSEIARLFPDDTIIGEEFGESGGKPGARRWIIDPIDGTKSFIHGVPLYGVMMGVEDDGEIIAGVVNLPAMGEIVIARRGQGCWWNGRRARASATEHLSDALVLTSDVASNYKHGKGAQWERITSRARLVRTWGDCYGHLLVATGRAGVMIDPIMSPWDCAALKIICEEAGGTFTDYDGKPTIYSCCAIATNGALFDEVMKLVHGQ